MTVENKSRIDWIENSLKAYGSQDAKENAQVSTNLKEALKKTGVTTIHSAKGAYTVIKAAGNILMGFMHFVKVFVYDMPEYALAADDVAAEKTWNTIKFDVNAAKGYAYELYQDVGSFAVDASNIIEYSGRTVYHLGKATTTSLTFMYDALKAAAKSTETIAENLPSSVGPKAIARRILL